MYKLQFIDRVETEALESIEAFLGSRVHETLQKLYEDLRHQKKDSLEDLFSYLHKLWDDNWDDDSILIVKEEYGPENYMAMAEKYITAYYKRYHPFDQGKTIALEQRISIDLDESGDYQMSGVIDRLSEAKDGYYEIHDYKTSSKLPLNEYIVSDRQLALYMIGVKDGYPDVRDVRLIWHFLAFDKEVDSTRTDAELEQLKKDTIGLIDMVEGDERFVAKPSKICDWCEFKPVCRQWSHLYKIKEKPGNEYLSDSGVKLVNRYAELKSKQKLVNDEIGGELEKLEEAIIRFAEKEKVDCVFGSKNKVKIALSERYSFPSKNSKEREELEQILEKYGKLQEVQQLDTAALGKIIQEKQLDDELLKLLKDYIEIERSKRLYISKISNR